MALTYTPCRYRSISRSNTPWGYLREAATGMTDAKHHLHGAAVREPESGKPTSAKQGEAERSDSRVHRHMHGGDHEAGAERNVHHGHGETLPAPGLVKDPVCGMDVDPHSAGNKAEHGGRTYYFCSARCRERFAAEPTKYVAPAPA